MLTKIISSQTPVQKNLKALYDRTAAQTVTLLPGQQYLIMSDLHMGNGNGGDDLAGNGDMLKTIVGKYYQKKARYHGCVLNGDVYELLKFSKEKVLQTWQPLNDMLHDFPATYQTEGNHDTLKEQGFSENVHPALRLVRQATPGNEAVSFFVLHGHQVDGFNNGRFHDFTKISLRILGFLGAHNFAHRFGSPRKSDIEAAMYAFAKKEETLVVIGHTHRPLFESYTKGQDLERQIYLNIELARQAKVSGNVRLLQRLLAERARLNQEWRRYREKHLDAKDATTIYSDGCPLPLLFNSGCVIGKDGMTMLELSYEKIALVYWTRTPNEKYADRPRETLTVGKDRKYYKYVLRQETMDGIIDKMHWAALTPD